MHRSEYHAVSPWTPHETDESGNQRRGARGRDQVNSACCRSSSRADRCRSAWRCDSICARALLRTMCLLGWFSFLPDALSAAATASSRNLFSAGVRFISRFMAISGQNNSAQSARHGEPHEEPAAGNSPEKRWTGTDFNPVPWSVGGVSGRSPEISFWCRHHDGGTPKTHLVPLSVSEFAGSGRSAGPVT